MTPQDADDFSRHLIIAIIANILFWVLLSVCWQVIQR